MKPQYAVIWTTTPWTLPGNQAVAVGADIEYALVTTARSNLIVLPDLVETVLKRYGLEGKPIARAKGADLEGIQAAPPVR